MTDYISRADAIEAVRGLSVLVDDEDFPYFEEALKALRADWNKAMESAQELLSALPSAETHGIRTETHDVCLDLISRQGVLCILEKMMIDRPLDSDRWVIRDIDKAINALPSADAVEVVRCKDCKYGEERIEDYRCWMLDEDWDIRFSPMHFCSYGKRREDGEA